MMVSLNVRIYRDISNLPKSNMPKSNIYDNNIMKNRSMHEIHDCDTKQCII